MYPAGVGSPVPAVLKTLSPSLANLDISLGSIPAGSIGSPSHANLPTSTDSISIERPEKFGGNVTYNSYDELEADFAQKNLHPGDLKNTVGEHMVKIIAPIRDKISLSNELFELIKNSH